MRQLKVVAANFMRCSNSRDPRGEAITMRSRLTAMCMLAAVALGADAAAGETLTVALRPVADEKAVFATVESISVVPARGRIGGTIVQLGVREGDPVTRGQAIATIGDDKLALQMKSLDAQIDALQAQASQAQTDFTRIEGLWSAARSRASGSTRRAPRSTWRITACGRRQRNARWCSSSSTRARCWRPPEAGC